MKKLVTVVFSLVFVAAASLAAHADTIGTTETFTLTANGCSSSCGTGPYGTILLTQTATGVTVLETLLNGDEFVSTGAGKSLEFDSNGTITTASVTTGFTAGGSASASTFGSFTQSIACSGCGPGASAPLTGPLSFTVAGATVSGFTANSDGYYFTSDIIGNGNTGNVGALGSTPIVPSPAPEPSSLLLLGTGILGGAAAMRRKVMSSFVNR